MPLPGYSEISKGVGEVDINQPTNVVSSVYRVYPPPRMPVENAGLSPVKMVHNPGGDWHPGWGGRSKLYQASNINPDAPWDGNIYLGISSCSCGHFSPFHVRNYSIHGASDIEDNNKPGNWRGGVNDLIGFIGGYPPKTNLNQKISLC